MALEVLHPLAAAAVGGRQACVVDARLVFSRLGLLTVTRLASEFSVWLPAEVKQLLRDTRAFRAAADQLVPRTYCTALRGLDVAAQVRELTEELAEWARLPEDPELAGVPMYFIGDRADEACTPPGLDRGTQERAEQLAEGLETLIAQADYDLPRGGLVSACVRDTVALCAALQPSRAFILTRLEDDGQGPPAICDYLDAWGVPSTEAPTSGGRAGEYLSYALARAGIEPIKWAGVPLAAVYVMVSGFPVLGKASRLHSKEDVGRQWTRASVFWHAV